METSQQNPPAAAGSETAQPRRRRSFAHVTMRIGLEGRILAATMILLSAALGATCWVWASQSYDRITLIMGEQAHQIAHTLSLGLGQEISQGQKSALQATGEDLLKSRHILFIAFYDAHGRGISIVHRHAEDNTAFSATSLQTIEVNKLASIRRGMSPRFGEFLEVSDPVFWAAGKDPGSGYERLVGYVAVGVTPALEQMQVARANAMATGIGCVLVLLSFPLAYILVRRIFAPIRQLVAATNRIAAGDLGAQQGAIDRTDAIGELARAFNEMVITVKKHRESLQNSNMELEKKVAQRTSQLEAANDRLSKEIAEKEDFLRAVSHDLNAPLRNISGMASMLLMKHRDKFDEDIVHRLERIQKNVEVETDLIAELLELSRIKTRRQKMEMVEIRPLIKELEGMFENDLKTRQIKLVIDTPLPVLFGERPRFRQVFQNLIDNAIKYIGEGPNKEIHVGCSLMRAEAEFYVRDTGMGIDSEDLEKVFFVFRRGKNIGSGNIAGKGVGLALVKSIIETYSGAIRVESQSGKGSTFRFTINGQYVSGGQGSEKAMAQSAMQEVVSGKE